jgi:hypothetical protein
MSPSILQLQSIGMQDVYLTKDPEVNVFKYRYYRYVNFATDIVKLELNEIASFNKKTFCNIPKRGHLLSKMYLHLRLPPLDLQSGTYLCWSDVLGYAIFNGPIELEINGIIVDRLYPQFLDIWDELTCKDNEYGKNGMILKSDVYRSTLFNGQQPVDLMIPLNFWFTKQYSSALPLLSMYNQDIRVSFKLRDFSQLVNYDGGTPAPVYIQDSKIYAEYIFLDEVILDTFQRQKHTYIIEQTQYHGDEIVPANTTVFQSSLKFNNPVKEIVFGCVETQNIESNNYFSYQRSSDDLPLIQEASLLLDGKKRFDSLPEYYYRTVFPDSVHSKIPMRYIYSMPFSLKPEDNQPTGSLNMSRFDDTTLALKLAQGNPECYLFIYAVSYNVLTIENGTFSLEFAS